VRTAANLLLQSSALPSLTQPLIGAVALAYFVIVAAIATWASRRTRSARDFFVAGEGIGLWPMAIATIAASLSGFTFIGGPGLVYALGLGAVFIVLPVSVTSTLGAWVLAKRLRLLGEVRGLMTVPDAIGARYRSPAAQGLAAVAILVAVVGYMATNVLALGLVIDAIFHTGLAQGIWIGSAVTVAYSVSGGILAGVYTDLFQGFVMSAASILVFWYALRTGGGMTGLSTSILSTDPVLLSPWGRLTPLAALSFFFVFGIGALGQPHVLHKVYMLRDPRQLRWYPLVMTVATFVTLLLFLGVGLAVKAGVSRGDLAALARPDDATPTFLFHFTPVLLAAVVFSGVAAAIMSTVNSFLSIGAAALTHDLPLALGRRPRNELRRGRLATVAIALAATVVAGKSSTLVAFLGIFGWGLFASTLVPALAIGLNWPGATRAAAIGSIATGLGVTLVFESLAWFRLFTFPAGVTATALALVASLAVFLVVSWLDPARGTQRIDADVALVMDI
jgi:Na+/proline symporter